MDLYNCFPGSTSPAAASHKQNELRTPFVAENTALSRRVKATDAPNGSWLASKHPPH